jgi:hypothetical protein
LMAFVIRNRQPSGGNRLGRQVVDNWQVSKEFPSMGEFSRI